MIWSYVNVVPHMTGGCWLHACDADQAIQKCLASPFRNCSCCPNQCRPITEKCGQYFWLAVVIKKLRADLGGGGGLWP